jgi:hypothetical protein
VSNVAQFPKPVKCSNCEHAFVGTVCPLCKEERPSYTALKNITARARAGVQPITKPLPPCRYRLAALCDCGLRGLCLEPA